MWATTASHKTDMVWRAFVTWCLTMSHWRAHDHSLSLTAWRLVAPLLQRCSVVGDLFQAACSALAASSEGLGTILREACVQL